MKKTKCNALTKLILFLILLFAAVAFLTTRAEKSGDGDRFSEKRVATDEIRRELSFGIYADEDWDTFFDVYHSEYLTGDMLEALSERLAVKEYIELPKHLGRRIISRAEWKLVYEQILDILDMERAVEKEALLVLGVMEAQEANVLITNQGDYYTALPLAYFEMWNGYELYCIKETCIGVAGAYDGELEVKNAYLERAEDGGIAFLYGGAAYETKIGGSDVPLVTGVCDIIFQGNRVTSLRMKQDTITGELLSYDDTAIEIEGYGKVPHAGKIPVYQTYGEVAEKSLSDVILGNMEVEYVTGEDQVCAIVIRQPANIETIRVLLLAEDGENYREDVYLKCDTDAVLKCGDWEADVAAGNVVPASEFLAASPAATFVLTPQDGGTSVICTSDGSAASNSYAGTLEVRSRPEGYTVVNELPFEEYLYAVVPSEMPSTYAAEALKAQAVCARSYAYIQLLRSDLAEYGAHINDSTSYQVYNKVPATEASVAAVQQTAGELLTYQGNPVEAYYFSTSMGYTDTAEVWNVSDMNAYGYLKRAYLNTDSEAVDLSEEDAFLDYIGTVQTGYDSDIKYYRWYADADYSDKTEELNAILLSRYAVSPHNIEVWYGDAKNAPEAVDAAALEKLGAVTGIQVLKRSTSGSVLTLELVYERGSVQIKTEYNIRKILGAGVKELVYADGSKNTQAGMLPSAFCAVIWQKDGTVTLRGGGYGHGLGMSQNAANGMAKAGMSYEDILHYFYHDIKIDSMQ